MKSNRETACELLKTAQKLLASEGSPDSHVIRIEVTKGDGNKSLMKILQLLQYMGSIGTSRTVEVEGFPSVGWDGDGASKITSITVDGATVPPKKFKDTR